MSESNAIRQLQILFAGSPTALAHQISRVMGYTKARRKACEVRWGGWLRGDSLKTVRMLEIELMALGYRLEIVRIEDDPPLQARQWRPTVQARPERASVGEGE